MDIFSHGVWGNLQYRLIPYTREHSYLIGWGIFFSVFPDLLAFGHAFIWMFIKRLKGELKRFPRTPEEYEVLPIHRSTLILYNFSHSLIIWALVVLISWIIIGTFPWPLLGWAVHIVIDIPTHEVNFYPTPYLWPLPHKKINGYSWANRDFMAFNIMAIVAAYILFIYL